MLLWQEEVTWETGPGFFIFFFSLYERLPGMDLAPLCPQASPEEMGSCAFSDPARFCSHLPHNPIELRDVYKRGRDQEPDRGILKLKSIQGTAAKCCSLPGSLCHLPASRLNWGQRRRGF